MAQESGEVSGFSRDQLIIYKLGQIESHLSSLSAKFIEHTIDTKQDIADLKVSIESAAKRVGVLEGQYNGIRSRFLGAAAAISFVFIVAKVFIEKWLNL